MGRFRRVNDNANPQSGRFVIIQMLATVGNGLQGDIADVGGVQTRNGRTLFLGRQSTACGSCFGSGFAGVCRGLLWLVGLLWWFVVVVLAVSDRVVALVVLGGPQQADHVVGWLIG